MSEDYRFRFAAREELHELFLLMRQVYDALENKDLFSVENIREEWFHDVLNRGGFGVVAQSPAGGTAGYLMVNIPGDSPESLGLDIGLPPEALAQTAEMDTAAVLPAHRGHGLERRMLEWAESRLPDRFRYLLCTVSPDNAPSLRSVTRCGYRIAVTKMKYGGHLRHVLVKDRRAQ